MKKDNKLPNIIVLFILTVITLLFWISYNIYQTFIQKPSPVVLDEIIEPLIPKLDTETFNQIEEKNYPI